MYDKKTDKNKIFQKIMIGVVLLSAVVILKAFNLGEYLTLSYIKASQENFALLYADNQLMIILVYAVVYVLAAALSLPGAVVLTLAGGALRSLDRNPYGILFEHDRRDVSLPCFAVHSS
jgi:hypothetical protein